MANSTPNYSLEELLEKIDYAQMDGAAKIVLRELVERAFSTDNEETGIGLQSVIEADPGANFTDGTVRILAGPLDNKIVYYNTRIGSSEATTYEQVPTRVIISHANYDNKSACGIQLGEDLIFTRDFNEKVAKVILKPSANNVNFNFPTDMSGDQIVAMRSDCVKPYKSYVAILNQLGNETVPVNARVMQNDFESNITWTTDVIESNDLFLTPIVRYKATLNGAFTENKTVVIVYNGEAGNPIGYTLNGTDDFHIIVSGGNLGFLKNAFIEVRVYN